MNIEIIRYRLPIYWIGALINGDYTGISNEEAQEVDDFVNMQMVVQLVWIGEQKVFIRIMTQTLLAELVSMLFLASIINN